MSVGLLVGSCLPQFAACFDPTLARGAVPEWQPQITPSLTAQRYRGPVLGFSVPDDQNRARPSCPRANSFLWSRQSPRWSALLGAAAAINADSLQQCGRGACDCIQRTPCPQAVFARATVVAAATPRHSRGVSTVYGASSNLRRRRFACLVAHLFAYLEYRLPSGPVRLQGCLPCAILHGGPWGVGTVFQRLWCQLAFAPMSLGAFPSCLQCIAIPTSVHISPILGFAAPP